MKKLMFLFVVAFVFAFSTMAMASDIAFYVGAPNTDGWYTVAAQTADVATIIAQAGGLFNDIQQFDDTDAAAATAWIDDNTNDGEVDIIWLNGCMPSILYPYVNLEPEGSRAELWLDGGNMIINIGDWFAYVSFECDPYPTRCAANTGTGAANILDLPAGIIAGEAHGVMNLTVAGTTYLPSLNAVAPERPVNLTQVINDWEVAEIFGQNGDYADPVVLHNTVTDGYIAFINQATTWITDRGQTCAELIINWVDGEKSLLKDEQFATGPNPADDATGVSVETILTWARGAGAKWDKVYFGTDPCDMSLPQVKLLEVGITSAEYDPGDPNLRASTTYYWYITEVNSPDDYKGPLWSFTTVSGAAQCEYPVNGVVIAGDPYIPDPDYTYTEMTFIMGPTAVKHTGYLSKNRDDVVNRIQDANLGSPPLAGWGFGERYERLYYAGRPEYPPYESLIRGQVYYWTVDETDPFGNLYPGEIWSFAVQPYEAFVPSPPNEAIYIDPDVLLSWLAGYGAQGHDIFIGTSWEDVNNAFFTFPIPNSSPEYMGTTAPGVTSWQCDGLPTDTKFYWRIDGVQGRLPPTIGLIQKGHVWEFTTRGPIPGLAGEYYHHTGAAAPAGFETKVLVRIDPNVNFNFDTDPPPGVRPDGFSVRWTGEIAASHKGETYTFTTETDDGARLWVNGQLVVDQWVDQGPTAASGDIVLDDYGPYNIKMEYYENGGGAVARLYWQSSSTAYGIVPANFLSPTSDEAKQAWTAYGPYPPDGSLLLPDENLEFEPILSWGPGRFASTHELYFSTDFDDVNERNVAAIYPPDPCYHSPRLDMDQTYYWAVDESNSFGPAPGFWEGGVWSFTPVSTGYVMREWWLNIGAGNDVINLTSIPAYPNSPDGSELITSIEGPVDWAENYGSRIYGWLRPTVSGDHRFWISSDDDSELWLSTDEDPCNAVLIAYEDGSTGSRQWQTGPEMSALIPLEAQKKYYILVLMKEGVGGDNIAVAWQGPSQPIAPVNGQADAIIDGRFLSATLYDPPHATRPYPADGATDVQDRNPILSWLPGSYVQAINGHKLYFSINFEDVNGRLVTPITRTDPNYPVPAPPLLLDRTYYWAVDEVNSNGPFPNLWEGRVWSFTMSPCMTVDNMEDYNDRTQIRGVWTDGYASVGWGGVLPYLYPLNTASSGSNLNASTGVGSPLGVSGPIQGGDQAMVLLYDNDGHTYTGLPGAEEWAYDAATFSEIEANTVENLGVGQDWSGEGVKSLTMWFQGHPVSDGSSDFGSWPDFSVTGRGRDIWNSHDEFHFLAMWPWVLPIGQTTHVQMRVVGMDNTDPWAKAGLMIREKMTPYSKYAAVFVTPGNGITFQWRDVEGGPSGSAGETTNSTWNRALETPIYLKLERTSLGAFTASYSNTGDSWDWADVNVSQNPDVTSHIVSMGDDTDPCLYGGAAVTSHDGAQLCVADFNNWDAYPWPGTQPWVDGEIGLNAPEQLYVALQDTLNNISVIEHSDVNAATLTSWQEWNIKLTDFVGVNLDGIKKVRIGLGDRDVPQLGGSGALYVDNIQACPPRCIAALVKPLYDIAEPYDCIVDEKDLVLVGAGWLLRDEVITTQAPGTGPIAQYLFEGNFIDSVGTNHGDPCESPQIVYDAVMASNVVDLDGDNQWVSTDANAVDLGIDGNSPKTITAWAYTRSFNNGGIFDMGNWVNGQEFCLRTQTTVDLWRTQLYGFPAYDFDFSYPTENAWVHFALAYDGNDVTVYANGDVMGNRTLNLNTVGDVPFRIGKYNVADNFGGMIDDVRIYNYGLSKEEVAYIVANGAATLHVPILSDADVYKGEPPGSQWINLKDYSLIASKYLEEILWPIEE